MPIARYLRTIYTQPRYAKGRGRALDGGTESNRPAVRTEMLFPTKRRGRVDKRASRGPRGCKQVVGPQNRRFSQTFLTAHDCIARFVCNEGCLSATYGIYWDVSEREVAANMSIPWLTNNATTETGTTAEGTNAQH